jgi:hypothetical protein
MEFEKMFISFRRAALLSVIILGVCNVKAQKDPCSMTEQLSGGTVFTGNVSKDIGNGYHVELWSELNVGSVTCFGGDADCAFKASWYNCGDFLAHVGYYDGSAAKKHTELGRISAEYCYTRQGTAGNYSHIGIYGWTKTPLLEYYIVDDYFEGSSLLPTARVGTYTLDGDTYGLYKDQRYNAPCIIGTATFSQVFAVRGTKRQCGHVSVSEHFKKWEEFGIKLGSLYECSFLCETGGGSGSIEYTYATMRWKGQAGHGIVLGDVNNDDVITMADANAVVNYFLASDKPADFNVDAGDVNCDGDVTMADANQIVNIFLSGGK